MKFTNKHNLRAGIFEALTKDTYDGVKDDKNQISVSSLIGPPMVRQLWLKHSEEVEQDAIDMLWSVFGRSVHSVMDSISRNGRMIEERLEIEKEGFRLSGKPDIFDIERGILEDYKITSAWSLVLSGGSKEEWDKQLNCYAYLIRKVKGYEVKSANITAILRDWDKRKAAEDESYPQTPVKTIPVVLWSDEEQEKFITDRLRAHGEANRLPAESVAVCTKEERWFRPGKFAVKKAGAKRADRVFDTMTEAVKYVGSSKLVIEERPGVNTRCESYCPVAKFCPFGAKLKEWEL